MQQASLISTGTLNSSAVNLENDKFYADDEDDDEMTFEDKALRKEILRNFIANNRISIRNLGKHTSMKMTLPEEEHRCRRSFSFVDNDKKATIIDTEQDTDSLLFTNNEDNLGYDMLKQINHRRTSKLSRKSAVTGKIEDQITTES